MPRFKSTEVVQLSSCAFTVWWVILLGVHVVVAFYNVVYGYYYWNLTNAYLNHFHAIQTCREIVETALQTRQAYRMSVLLPRTLLNRFYIILIAVNCWAPAVVNTWFFQRDEARKRYAVIVLDCALGLMACVGVVVIVVLGYTGDFDLKLGGFDYLTWYNDEWMARAYNEFQVVIVVSWMDLASRTFFSLGLIATTTNMKELLVRLPQKQNRVVQSVFTAGPSEGILLTVTPPPTRKRFFRYDSKLLAHIEHLTLHSAHILFGIWGVAVLGFHIQASTQPLLPQCLMQVRPWGVSPEVDEKWSEFDSFTVVQMLIRHCPALEVPARFSDFHSLRGIKVYNSTIVDWGESAALTSTNHPTLLSLFLIRVNMTDGVLSAGFLSADFPPTVYDVEFCVTNLRELPDDLDTKWAQNLLLQFEYSQLTVVDPVLIRLGPGYLALTGNPITELPPDIFEIDNTYLIGISDMDIHELPRNVTKLSATLAWVFMRETNVSFFWDWADELVERMNPSSPWIAGYSPYCEDLAKIENGTATAFSVTLSPEYSQTLMDPSAKNIEVIGTAVNCKATTRLPSGGGVFHPLFYEDSINAISTPPALLRPIN
ncbi:hypothetical protein PF010_g557 [Phytophthora fragariae]|uniref:Uncharacterized protein n=1 Tax=Phytophthora fragariae TaxID=53985 RepID=A0A6G0M2J1_9STRA|nr:hypothetical protein PF010_g557 [Phytophthora fragariae]